MNDAVRIPGRNAEYHVNCVFRLENYYIYQLQGLPDFLVKECRLEAVEELA